MSFQPIPEALLDFIRKYDTFFIIGHIEPDGDCVGSQIALKHFLERIGKEARLFSPGPFKRKEVRRFGYRFEERFTEDDKRTEAGVFLLDCAALDRVGDLAQDLSGREIAVIDHHSSRDGDFGAVRYIEPKASCVTLLVQKLIESMGDVPDPEEAYFLFFGFSTEAMPIRVMSASLRPRSCGGDFFHPAMVCSMVR